MTILTLTPDTYAYVVAVLAILAASTASVTAIVQMRWRRMQDVSFHVLYIMTMALIAAAALVVLDLPSVVGWSWRTAALAIPLGVVLGFVALRGETALKGRIAAQQAARKSRKGGHPVPTGQRWLRQGYRAEWGASQVEWKPGRPDALFIDASMKGNRLLGALLVSGILEEVLFRGVLVELTLAMDSLALRLACLLLTLAAFSTAHIRFGVIEGIAKLPLGICALAGVLLLHSVIPAIVAHLVFNYRAWWLAQVHDQPAGGSFTGWPDPGGRSRALPGTVGLKGPGNDA